MGTATQQELDGVALAAEIDQLGEKIDNAARLIARLRQLQSELEDSCQTHERNWDRLQKAAEVDGREALIERVEYLVALEEENTALRDERAMVARRLGALIEKVDLLEGDS